MNIAEETKKLDQFEAHYQYDTTYMKEMMTADPEGYQLFVNFMPMAYHRKELDPAAYYVAKLATMLGEDCGACLQLNINMALEAGIDKEVVKAAVKGGEGLDPFLRQIHDYTTRVVANDPDRQELYETLVARLGKAGMSELALAITSSRVFPTIKRTLNHDNSCKLMEFAF